LARVEATGADIDVLLDEAETDETVERLSAGTLDIALVYEYEADPRAWPLDLVRFPLLRESLILLARRGRVATTNPHRLSEYSDEVWIAGREGMAGPRNLERLCAEAGFVPNVSYRTDDYEVVRGLVAAQLGIALVPALAYHHDEAVTAQVLEADHAARRVLALYRASNTSPTLVSVLNALARSARTRSRSDPYLRVEAEATPIRPSPAD
jgi:DNA-binding transcriptional LysR family regulator